MRTTTSLSRCLLLVLTLCWECGNEYSTGLTGRMDRKDIFCHYLLCDNIHTKHPPIIFKNYHCTVFSRTWVSRRAGCRYWLDAWSDKDIPECANGREFVMLARVTEELGEQDFTSVKNLTECLVSSKKEQTQFLILLLLRRPADTWSTDLLESRRNHGILMAKGHLSWLFPTL